MFPDPGLVITETVEVLEQLQITVQGEGRVDPRLVHGRHENSKAQTHGHIVAHGPDVGDQSIVP